MTQPAGPDWSDTALQVDAVTPAWFKHAVKRPIESRFVTVEGCPIHYLTWPGATAERGIVFVHGGGAHANWWRFIAPWFADRYACVALDLSGMGDSGRRETYDARQRSAEMLAVIADAGLGRAPYVIGHSFGGYMTMRLAAVHGDELGGAVIVDSPIRTPEAERNAGPRRIVSLERHYPSFEIGVERFRLLPAQECENPFLVEFIARHSLRRCDAGWTWKFDVAALGSRRWDEPFAEHFANMSCRRALIYGAQSALVTSDTAGHMCGLLGPRAPVIEIPGARHHIMLDQPLAFVAALRALLASWDSAT